MGTVPKSDATLSVIARNGSAEFRPVLKPNREMSSIEMVSAEVGKLKRDFSLLISLVAGDVESETSLEKLNIP